MTLAKQVPLDFSKTIPDVRKRVVRAGAESRYSDCLEYLRLELKSGRFERINPEVFAQAFKVTSSFLFMVTATGAITAKRFKGKGMHYRAEPKLATLTAKELLNFRLAEFPNPPYEPEPVAGGKLTDESASEFEPMAGTKTGVIRKPEPTPEQQQFRANYAKMVAQPIADAENSLPGPILPEAIMITPPPVFLVGRMAGHIVSCNTDRRFDSPEQARDFIAETDSSVEKSIVLQVVQVYERNVILKPSSL